MISNTITFSGAVEYVTPWKRSLLAEKSVWREHLIGVGFGAYVDNLRYARLHSQGDADYLALFWHPHVPSIDKAYTCFPHLWVVKNFDRQFKPVCHCYFRMIESRTSSKRSTRSSDNDSQMGSNSQSIVHNFAGCQFFLSLTTPVSHFCKWADAFSLLTAIQPMLAYLSWTDASSSTAIVPPVLMAVQKRDRMTLNRTVHFHHRIFISVYVSLWGWCGME